MPPTITIAEFPDFLRGKAQLFFDLQQKTLDIGEQLRKSHPDWVETEDIRLDYFGQMTNHCMSTGFLMLAAGDCIGDANWWKRRLGGGSAADLKIFVEEIEKKGRDFGFLGGWSITEGALRRLISAYKRTTVTGSIFPACENFYRTELSHPDKDDFIDLFRLAITSRNAATHNRYTFYPDSGGDRSIMFRGETYDFVVGKEITFFKWDFVIQRLHDFIDVFLSTVEHSPISALKSAPSH